ncbi:flagellar assembly protein FliW [Haliovirga abyssi]|uniref:Flagellar assembly factor FliW n=1 Tax=Haliovirga abyssi TaxID=2996794 RepID=A0AAU9D526_9FUSO|nr:flagellar assembly protein FliW [Haliovirga abyssi]BDU51079.1 flagellar assembly factor FliW [Haliovirga abyssi]
MKISTTRFGEIEIEEAEIINFPEGILGFEDIKKYVIFNMEEGNPLKWLQAIEEPALAFVIIRPYEFMPKYALEISEKDTEDLKLTKPEDSEIFSIVVIPDDPSKMTANLQGPIVINAKRKIAKQVISTNSRHKLKHYVLEEMEKNLPSDQEVK